MILKELQLILDGVRGQKIINKQIITSGIQQIITYLKDKYPDYSNKIEINSIIGLKVNCLKYHAYKSLNNDLLFADYIKDVEGSCDELDLKFKMLEDNKTLYNEYGIDIDEFISDIENINTTTSESELENLNDKYSKKIQNSKANIMQSIIKMIAYKTPKEILQLLKDYNIRDKYIEDKIKSFENIEDVTNLSKNDKLLIPQTSLYADELTDQQMWEYFSKYDFDRRKKINSEFSHKEGVAKDYSDKEWYKYINEYVIKNNPPLLFPYGKYKGQKVAEVYKIDPEYLNWLIRKIYLNDKDASQESWFDWLIRHETFGGM